MPVFEVVVKLVTCPPHANSKFLQEEEKTLLVRTYRVEAEYEWQAEETAENLIHAEFTVKTEASKMNIFKYVQASRA